MNTTLVAGAIGTVTGVLVVLVLWRRLTAGKRTSKRAHDRAQQRDRPVELGETYELGVTEFTDHHSGKRVAVGNVEGFVVFIEDVPDRISEGDVIRATITSFNRNETSADAIFDGVV